jgi:hypothetical protein
MYRINDIIELEECPHVRAVIRLSSTPMFSQNQNLWYALGCRRLDTRDAQERWGSWASTPVPFCWRDARVVERGEVPVSHAAQTEMLAK